MIFHQISSRQHCVFSVTCYLTGEVHRSISGSRAGALPQLVVATITTTWCRCVAAVCVQCTSSLEASHGGCWHVHCCCPNVMAHFGSVKLLLHVPHDAASSIKTHSACRLWRCVLSAQGHCAFLEAPLQFTAAAHVRRDHCPLFFQSGTTCFTCCHPLLLLSPLLFCF